MEQEVEEYIKEIFNQEESRINNIFDRIDAHIDRINRGLDQTVASLNYLNAIKNTGGRGRMRAIPYREVYTGYKNRSHPHIVPDIFHSS